MIVICPEHRDGSTPISFIRSTPSIPSSDSNEKQSSKQNPKKRVHYIRLSHTPSPEVEEGRNAQLRIRLWEMGLVHASLLKLDLGEKLSNLNTSTRDLDMWKGKMDVHRPGKITFAGHSFGASTTTQLVKSTFYAPRNAEAPSSYTPLFTPSSRSPLTSQITTDSPVILLDPWCLPLRAESTRWLWNLPFPSYTSSSAPGGSSLLCIESQAFYNWTIHLSATKRLLSPDPSSKAPFDYKGKGIKEPNFYYARSAAHLSQSDFGVLFPWFTKRFLAVEDPERILRLNVRAVTQVLRNCGIEMGRTSHADMEMEDANAEPTDNDEMILKREGVEGWLWLSTDIDVESEEKKVEEGEGEMREPSEAVVGNELLKQKEGTVEKLRGHGKL